MNRIFKGIWRKSVWVHLLLILLFLTIPVIASPDFRYSLDIFNVRPFLENFSGFVLLTGFFYLNYYLLIPRFFLKKKLVLYGFLLLGVLLVTAAIVFVFSADSCPPAMPHHGGPPDHAGKNYISYLATLCVPFGVIVFFSISLTYSRRAKTAELDKLKSELLNLRYQLQPHFLFNNLNNIYILSMVEPEKTPVYILKLSDVLRYLLQTGAEDRVSVRDDLHFCQLCIDLQSLRFEDRKSWDIQIDDPVPTLKMVPFLLIPFIENVFKYGVHPEKDSPIVIRIAIDDYHLTLYTRNQKINQAGENLLLSHRIGLEKTQELLQLYYEGRHTLVITETESTFEVNLKIRLEA